MDQSCASMAEVYKASYCSLHVRESNRAALALYRRCGYSFPQTAGAADRLLVGFCDLVRSRA